jgi:hypothetical protein
MASIECSCFAGARPTAGGEPGRDELLGFVYERGCSESMSDVLATAIGIVTGPEDLLSEPDKVAHAKRRS